MQTFDYIIVGSGCSGAMAAQSLVEAGKQVAMLDVGEDNPDYDKAVPDQDYLSLRTTDEHQYRYLIGERAEGVVVNDSGKGAQITPPREFLIHNTDTYIPLDSTTFTPIESLAYGGLGSGWGLQCWEFSRPELVATGLPPDRMFKAYETISKRIGISASRDNAADYTLGQLETFDASPDIDRNMRRIHDRYLRHKSYFDRRGIVLGRTPLALITANRGDRRAYAYRDMDFYDDNGQSAWRPRVTVNQLRKAANFNYINGFLALRFNEDKKGTVIYGINPVTKQEMAFRCNTLLLASGALGSARIALRSLADKDTKLPLLCNPYTYVPSAQPSMFGRGPEARKVGFGQLSAFTKPALGQLDDSILTLYSYQSLMLFRIIRQAPLNFSDARPIMQYVASGLVVTGIQHSDKPTSAKYLQLRPKAGSLTGDKLEATYVLSDDELAGQKKREDVYIKAMRRTGLFALKRLNPGHGSSVHYAGTLPFSKTEKPLTLATNGRLHGTRSVYIVDSSGFNFLPARGLTFSILANAHITAENILQT